MKKTLILTIIVAFLIIILSTNVLGGWWNFSFGYEKPINTSELSSNLGFLINGSNCFKQNGSKECIRTTANGSINIYYNDNTDINVVQDNTSKHDFYYEFGSGESNNQPLSFGKKVKEFYDFENASGNAYDKVNSTVNWVFAPATRNASNAYVGNRSFKSVVGAGAQAIDYGFSSNDLGGVCWWQYIESKGGASGTSIVYVLSGYSGNEKIYVGFGKDDGVSIWYFNGAWVNSGTDFISGDWEYYCFNNINFGAGTYDMYKNGVVFQAAAGMDPNQDFDGIFRNFMHTGFAAGSYYLYDELTFYNDVLTADEINETYQNYLGTEGYGGLGSEETAPALPAANDTINLSVPNPPSGSLYNNLPIIFNVTGNFTFNFTNCSLYINDTINITVFNVSNGTNIFVNFTLINVSEGNITWFIGCEDNTSAENTSLMWFTYDFEPPVITDDFVNNTMVFNNNLTGQFNFTDNLLLHTLNVTIDGVVIFNVTHIHANNYSYNLSYNVTNLSVGNHELVVKIADGHTSDFLLSSDDYNPSNGLFNDYIKYNFRGFYDRMYIKTELKSSSLLDDWSAEQKFDRYTETLIPNKPNVSQTFIVSSDKPIYIASVPGKYGDEWLIIGDHWKDFVLKDEPNSKVSIKKINDYMVEVVVNGIKNNPSKLVFDSVGDLNIVNVTYNFVRVNMTETYTSIVYGGFTSTYNLSVEFGGLPFDLTGFVASGILDLNGTNHSASLLSFDNISANFSVVATIPNVNFSENISHRWYFNLTNLTNPPLFTLEQEQFVYNVSVGVCVDPVNHTIVNFSYYDEISLNRTNLTNTYDLAIYDGTFYYNQTNNTFPRNISNRLCTNIDPTIATYNWDMWGSFILSEPTYITRVIDIESAAPIPISNNPYSNVSFFIIKVANSSTVTFTWLTESFQLIDGTMRIFRCGVNGSRDLVASTSVISGAATVNLELLTAVYSYDIIIGGLIFSDLGGYTKCHVESQTSITYFVDIGGVDVTPIIGLNGIPCLLNRTNDDVVNLIWSSNPEDTDYVQGCLGAYVNNIYGSSLIQENCSNETDGYSFEVNFSVLGLVDYVVVGDLRQSGLISSCDNEVNFKTSTPAQDTAGITFLIAAFFIVAAMILMFAGDGEIQLVGGIAGLVGVSVLGLLKFPISVIVSLIIFLLLILVIGRATRRRT